MFLAFQSQVLQNQIMHTNAINDMKQQLNFIISVVQDMHGNTTCCQQSTLTKLTVFVQLL